MLMKNAVLLALLASGAARADDAAAGRAVFAADCSICHSVHADRNMTGPSLFGVVGRRAGQVPHFPYSSANETSALTWNAATLNRYLASPATVVPGTTMTYPGLKDAGKRGDLVAYLTTLH